MVSVRYPMNSALILRSSRPGAFFSMVSPHVCCSGNYLKSKTHMAFIKLRAGCRNWNLLLLQTCKVDRTSTVFIEASLFSVESPWETNISLFHGVSRVSGGATGLNLCSQNNGECLALLWGSWGALYKCFITLHYITEGLRLHDHGHIILIIN